MSLAALKRLKREMAKMRRTWKKNPNGVNLEYVEGTVNALGYCEDRIEEEIMKYAL